MQGAKSANSKLFKDLLQRSRNVKEQLNWWTLFYHHPVSVTNTARDRVRILSDQFCAFSGSLCIASYLLYGGGRGISFYGSCFPF